MKELLLSVELLQASMTQTPSHKRLHCACIIMIASERTLRLKRLGERERERATEAGCVTHLRVVLQHPEPGDELSFLPLPRLNLVCTLENSACMLLSRRIFLSMKQMFVTTLWATDCHSFCLSHHLQKACSVGYLLAFFPLRSRHLQF